MLNENKEDEEYVDPLAWLDDLEDDCGGAFSEVYDKKATMTPVDFFKGDIFINAIMDGILEIESAGMNVSDDEDLRLQIHAMLRETFYAGLKAMAVGVDEEMDEITSFIASKECWDLDWHSWGDL
jgi:hypothetical protein